MKNMLITPSMALCITQGMNEVSRIDGQVEEERNLLRAFYNNCRLEVTSLPLFETIEANPFDDDLAAQSLVTNGQKKLFISLCVLVGYADGDYTALEKQMVERLAFSIGAPEDFLRDIENKMSSSFLAAKSSGQRQAEIGKIMAALMVEES